MKFQGDSCLYPALSCAAAFIFLQLLLKSDACRPHFFRQSLCQSPSSSLPSGVYCSACLAMLSSFLSVYFLLSCSNTGCSPVFFPKFLVGYRIRSVYTLCLKKKHPRRF